MEPRPTPRSHRRPRRVPQVRMLLAWCLVSSLCYAFLPHGWLESVRWLLIAALVAIIGWIVALRLRR